MNEIKVWRESLAKYEPDWEEVISEQKIEKPAEKSKPKQIVFDLVAKDIKLILPRH